MERCGRRDRDTRNLIVAQYRIEFSDPRVVALGELARRVAVGIADRGQCTKFGKVANQVLAPISAADRRNPHRAIPLPAGHQCVLWQFFPPCYRSSGDWNATRAHCTTALAATCSRRPAPHHESGGFHYLGTELRPHRAAEQLEQHDDPILIAQLDQSADHVLERARRHAHQLAERQQLP
jgi:hypothetical protein